MGYHFVYSELITVGLDTQDQVLHDSQNVTSV